MSGSVDDEVVRMRFDNNAFERGVATTLGSLSKLKNSLSFSGADKGLQNVENKANKFNMNGMASGIEGVSKKFLALTTIGLTALSQITSRAISAGARFAKSFTVQPLLDGFHEYETQLNSVQTILANTGLKGTSGMAQVNGALNELNTYSDKTIYNFGEMARNIGTFTAAGVKLKPATSAIKGIANVAALSGSSSEQASTAMYQLSQAIANNKVGLQDWNSVVNAGMGGKVFQQALFNVGKMKGTLKGVDANTTFDQWTKSGNSFRDSLKSGWITGDVLTSTLSQFTGDLSDAQLKSQGYNATQIKQIQEQAKTAADAATKVKTFSQLIDTLKEAVGSGWSQSFQTIFGNFDEAKSLWTGVSNSIGGLINNSSKARNKVLSDWKALNGRTNLIRGIQQVFRVLGEVVKPIKDAFRSIFPPTTGAQLAGITAHFKNFFLNLKIGPETADRLKRTFAGVFAVFDIGKQIVAGIFHVFTSLFGTLLHGSGGFLSMTANIGDMVVAFDKALKQGGLLKNFFKIVANVLAVPIHMFHIAAAAIGQLFAGFHVGQADKMTNSVTGAGNALARVADITGHVSNWFAGLGGKIKPGIDAVVRGFHKIGEALAKGLDSQAFGNILKGIQVGLLGGIVVMLKRFFSGGINVDVGGGFLGTAKEALEGVTGQMKAMQQELKAKMLLEIAAAIGIVAASVVILSLVNPTKLQNALKAMAVGFGELLGAMAILTKISGSAGFVKIPIMAASLNLLATAILILTAAVALMSRLSWDELQRGLTAIGILLGLIVIATYPLSANSAGMVRAGIGITAMAVALNLLYIPVKLFSMMSWPAIAKGLGTVGIALVGIAVAMRAMPKRMVWQGAALMLIATALNELYLAVRLFSGLSWQELGKGLLGVAGGLLAIAVGMKFMPKGMMLQSVALIAVGAALQLIARAVKSMAQMSWEEIGKGLVALGGSLLILAGGLFLMQESVGGAVALLVVAGALHVFVPALAALGSMKWSVILKGLVALAAAFGVLGLASLILAPVIPAMLALGVALGLVGVALLAFGAGAALLGIGLTAIAASGGAAIGVLLSGLKGLIEMLPLLAKSLATALVNFLSIIGKNAPVIIGAFVKLLNALLDAVPKIIPKLVPAIGAIITGILKVLVDNAPKIIKAGFQLLKDFLSGIRDNIGDVVKTVVDIVVKFLDALARNIGRIIAAGVNLLFKFLEGVARAAAKVPGEVVKIIGIFVTALFNNLGKIFSAGAKLLGKLVSGIFSGIGRMASTAVSVVGRFLSGITGRLGDLASKGAQMLGKLVGGLLGAVGGVLSKLWNAGWDMAKHLIDGLAEGIKGGVSTIKSAVGILAGETVDGAGVKFGIGGPSKVFDSMGRNVVTGFINGVKYLHGEAVNTVENLGSESVRTMSKSMNNLSKAISSKDLDFNPTIRPILDLDQFRKDATEIGGLMTTSPVVPVASYDQAVNISARQLEAQDSAATTPAADTPVSQVSLTQNNYSPKALSTVDIYRNTNNQLALAKKLAGVPDKS